MQEKKLFWIILFNLGIIAGEIVFGLLSNSFALIADALHNTADVMALFITYIALKLGVKKSSFRYTFGFIKAEMMAAFVNTLFLFLAMFFVMYEAIMRLFTPEVIEASYMISVALLALIANGISAYLLHSMGMHHHHHDEDHHHHEHEHHHHHDANIYSAYLHMLGDALISLGVVVAGVVIYFYEIYFIDSLLTLLFALYILKHSYPLLKQSFLSLIDANTTPISLENLEKIILEDERVLSFHDLHISQPNSKHDFISFHIIVNNLDMQLKELEEIQKNIEEKLRKLGFDHILIQINSTLYAKENIGCIL